ncbi:uncharacterized protein LOC144158326 isoform X1 [Haemaphysalis longicornis]
MRFLTPFFVLFFAGVVYSKKWREYGYRECCSCEDPGTPNNKWTVTKKEIQKAEKGGEGGGGGEEEGGGGSRGLKKGGRGEDDKGGGGELEEDSKRRRPKKVPDGGSQEEGAKARRPKKGRTDASEEEGRKRRRPKKAKGGGSEEEDTKRRKSKKGRGEVSEEEDTKRRKSKKGRGEGSEEEGSKRRKSKKGRGEGSEEEAAKRRKSNKRRGEGSEEEGAKRRKSKKVRGEGSEEEGTKRPRRKKGKGGGSEEEGAKPPGSGESGGTKGGLEEDGYQYHKGVISGDDEPEDFKGKFTKAMLKLQRQVLRRHNKWRKLHGVPPVENDEELSRYAQAYAYSLARQGVMKHRSRNKKYGENLFYSWSTDPKHHVKGKQVVDAWYDEIKMYHWGNTFQPGCGHFTQVVWRKCTKIGSGIAQYKGKIFVVTNYAPPGNVMGHFLKNVPRPGSPPSGGDEGGGKGQEGGGGEEEGGGKEQKEEEGGGRKDDYLYHGGVISGDDEPEDFKGKFTKAMLKLQRQVLKQHNKWRKLHGVPPVENDEELSRYAQAYAYSLARQGVMKHRRRNKKYGENLFYSWSSDPTSHVHGKQVVDAWYDEIKMYHWGNTFQPGCGHFTQVVWRKCTKIGSGIAKYKGKIFVVTNYAPPGNVMGRFLKNVPRPGSPPSGGDEGGGKGQEGGGGEEEGGGKGQKEEEGGGRKDDYLYHGGVISGDNEPEDFNGKFTSAMLKLQREVLRRHNKWRKLHGVPPVENSEKLSRYAQAYAYSLARQGVMKHRSRNKKYGENLFYSWSSDPTSHAEGKQVVDAWYDEIKMYHWGNTFQPGCGHFTQVVWRKCTKIGSGIAKYKGKIFVVTNYDPPGNVMGRFLKNVPRPGSPPSGGGEGGGKGQESGGGEEGGGKRQKEEGGGKKDDYFYHEGVIRGIEPTDFNGKFTKAMRKLQRQVLRVTNKYRSKHGVPPLQHSEQLCRYAQAYAFYLAKIGQMVHRSRNKKYGENLFYGSSADPDYHVHGRRAVDGWYDEIKLHRWTNAFQYASGHFTQLIWKSSRYLGSGIAKYRNKIFIVSNYDPPGNVHGLFLKNCPRPIS